MYLPHERKLNPKILETYNLQPDVCSLLRKTKKTWYLDVSDGDMYINPRVEDLFNPNNLQHG